MDKTPTTPSEIAKYLASERAFYSGGCGGRGYYASFDTDYDWISTSSPSRPAPVASVAMMSSAS